MAYPFVASAVNLGLARGPRLALIVHMAEGGGTVGYLSRPNPNGVSVHWVIERSGRIVQMLAEDRMHTSIRVSAIRTSDDPDGLYGRSHAVKVMGRWADIRASGGPNHAALAIEIEGFASSGPNAAQRDALRALWADVSARYPGIRALGHRDWADYKACPGRRIDWSIFGGHGAAPPPPPPRPAPPPPPDPEPLDAGVVVVTEHATPRAVSVPEGTRSFSFDPVRAVFRELDPIGPWSGEADAVAVFHRERAPKGTFVRLVTGPKGRRLVSAGAVTAGGSQ